MINANINQYLKKHAGSYGLQDDYLLILAEKNEKSKKKIEQLNYDELIQYSNFVKTDFKFYDEYGKVQFQSLIGILHEASPSNSALQNMLKNAKYIIELEAFATTTIEKLHNKIDSFNKTLSPNHRLQVKRKLNIISYEGLVNILKSERELRNFITN